MPSPDSLIHRLVALLNAAPPDERAALLQRFESALEEIEKNLERGTEGGKCLV